MRQSNLLTKILILLILINAFYTQSESQQIDKQTQHIQQFARTMSDFIPTETFTFTIGNGQQQNFILWPPVEIEKIRGVFYVDNSQDQEAANGDGFFVGCQVNGIMKKTFVNQRLGVFNLKLQSKPINLKFIFKADTKPLIIYLSYELRKTVQSIDPQSTDQNVLTKEQEQIKQKQSKIKQVSGKFQKVRVSVQGQQSSLRMILKAIGKHGKRLQNEVNYAHYRIIIETSIVILSGILGMWIIRRQMNSGYELLV